MTSRYLTPTETRRRKFILPALVLLLLVALVGTVVVAAAQTIPTITVVSVVRDQTVTVRTHNFPANRAFTVRMGPMGTRGVNGTVVATTNSGSGGTMDLTYNIPQGLQGSRQIAIRLDAPGGYFAFNWFYNNTTSGAVTGTPPPSTPAPTATPGPTGTPRASIPTFSIVAVERDSSVSIRTNNFPANQAFTVRMGALGTRGVNGTVAATTDSGSGGTFDATYTIPENLRGRSTIAIRLESPSGYYAYNWFYNSTTP